MVESRRMNIRLHIFVRRKRGDDSSLEVEEEELASVSHGVRKDRKKKKKTWFRKALIA